MKIYVLVILSLWLSVPICAQKYHDAALEEIQGPVKEVVYTDQGVASVFYDQEGREHKSMEEKRQRKYDDHGFLIGYEVDSNGMSWTVKVDYDNRHRMIQSTSTTDGGKVVNELAYNKNGQVEKSVVTISTKDVSRTYTSTFVYIDFDDHGNWLSRVRRRSHSAYYESRIIRY